MRGCFENGKAVMFAVSSIRYIKHRVLYRLYKHGSTAFKEFKDYVLGVWEVARDRGAKGDGM